MEEIFSKKFNNVVFEFKIQVFDNNEVWYEIGFNNNGNKDSFKMYTDNDGVWRIAARILPEWIIETEQEFNEVVIHNETL